MSRKLDILATSREFSFLAKLDLTLADFVHRHLLRQSLSQDQSQLTNCSYSDACCFPQLLECFEEGLWITLSFKNNDEAASVVTHRLGNCFESVGGNREKLKEFDGFLTEWVFSNAFVEKGFKEPMEELLYKRAKRKIPLRLRRDGYIGFWNEAKGNFEDFPLLNEVFWEKNSEVDKRIAELRENLFKQWIEKSSSPDELQREISAEFVRLYEDYLLDEAVKQKNSLIKSIDKIIAQTSSGNLEFDNKFELVESCLKTILWDRLFDPLECSNDVKWDSILYVPDSVSLGKRSNGLIFAVTGKKNPEDGLYQRITALLSLAANRMFTIPYQLFYIQQIYRASVRSAVGSIMSRNGSHNIGSHVLAALSHNVGTMPDDRVLYQYIQQRMDYIATVTTDFPHWRLSTMLVGNVMKEFMMQRHLLDHIAGSEGLKAYQFQTHSLAPNQKGAIRIHVRRIKDLCKGWETDAFWEDGVQADNFIVYSDAQNTGNAWIRHLDLSVAIPGGVVGQHAFYTILENVIRNAAKHDWARLSKEDRAVANLDLYIDFKDNPEAGMVECRVWTCITKADDKGGCIVLRAEACKTREAAKCIKDKICTSFIDEFGGLRKENWGIAEMRISAGYLIGSDIADIGGLGGEAASETQCKALKIIWPVEVRLDEEHSALGYRFNLFKPRELLVVIPVGAKVSDDQINQANSNSNQYGIWLKRESDVGSANDLAFSYVLFDRFDVDSDYRLRLPFRVIAKEVISTSKTERLEVAQRIIPTYKKPLFDMSNEAEVIALTKGGDKIQERCEKLLSEVYGVWLSHVVNRSDVHGASKPLVAIDVEGSGKGGDRKSLVTKTDLLMFVFEHSFNAAARSFLESERRIAVAAQMDQEDSESEEDVCNRVFESVLERIVNMKDRVLDSQIVLAERAERSLEQMGTEDFLRMQLAGWYDALFTSGALAEDETYECFASAPLYSKFVSFVCGPVLSQAEAFLAKYEEEFSTLPEHFKFGGGSSGDGLSEKPIEIANGVNVVVAFTDVDDRKADYYAKGACCYFRHGAQVSDAIGTYYEALSGAQGYLNSFVSFRERMVRGEISLREKRFLVQLVENAKTRVIIIDERVKDFMSRHDEVNKRLGGLGLAVLGDDDQEVINLFAECQQETEQSNVIFDVLVKNIRLGDYDILIIHQGIIDKLLKNHEDKGRVGEFLKKLIRKIRYVVVTTGRGTPANIPDEARVLPYSVVEDTILKCYPEKMVLVDAVMNVLPVRNKKGLES